MSLFSLQFTLTPHPLPLPPTLYPYHSPFTLTPHTLPLPLTLDLCFRKVGSKLYNPESYSTLFSIRKFQFYIFWCLVLSGWEGVRYKKLSAVIPTSNGFVATTKQFSTTGTRLGQFYCTECDISVNSQNQLDQHLLSQKHKLVASGQNTTSSHLATTQPRQTSSEMYNVNSQSQLDQQMLSSNRNVVASGRNKIQQQQQHNKPSPSSTGIQWNQFRCETCNISVNSQSQLDQHLSSPKHAAAENGQPPSGSGGRGRGQVRGRGRGQAGSYIYLRLEL